MIHASSLACLSACHLAFQCMSLLPPTDSGIKRPWCHLMSVLRVSISKLAVGVLRAADSQLFTYSSCLVFLMYSAASLQGELCLECGKMTLILRLIAYTNPCSFVFQLSGCVLRRCCFTRETWPSPSALAGCHAFWRLVCNMKFASTTPCSMSSSHHLIILWLAMGRFWRSCLEGRWPLYCPAARTPHSS